MKLDVVRDGKYLALVSEGSIEPFVIRNACGGRTTKGTIPYLWAWLDSQNQNAKPILRTEEELVALAGGMVQNKLKLPPTEHYYKKAMERSAEIKQESPAFETVEDMQRRGQIKDRRIDSLFESWYEDNHLKTPTGTATARAAYEAGFCQGQLRPIGQENAAITKIPDSPTTRHAYSHGEAMQKMMPKSKPHAAYVINWLEYPKDVFATPAEWCEFFDIEILDPDGWRGPNGQSLDLKTNIMEFLRRTADSTCQYSTAWHRAYEVLIKEPARNRLNLKIKIDELNAEITQMGFRGHSVNAINAKMEQLTALKKEHDECVS